MATDNSGRVAGTGAASDGAATTAAPAWARQQGPAQDPVTDRRRRMVTTLPAWEPLPPGEILVNRRREG